MRKEIKVTGDGSITLYIPEMDETYHSSHGALQEAVHVFIQNGISQIDKDEVSVFEMGLGTGLNALLTWSFAKDTNKKVNYLGIEAYPVELELLQDINHGKLISQESEAMFQNLHETIWNEQVSLDEHFSIHKHHDKIENWTPVKESFDVVYYDAFGPRAQGDMWQIEILQKMYDCLKPGGFLVTYCAKGQVKRDLKALGFTIEPLPGPPGKREMTRAWKSIPKHLL